MNSYQICFDENCHFKIEYCLLIQFYEFASVFNLMNSYQICFGENCHFKIDYCLLIQFYEFASVFNLVMIYFLNGIGKNCHFKIDYCLVINIYGFASVFNLMDSYQICFDENCHFKIDYCLLIQFYKFASVFNLVTIYFLNGIGENCHFKQCWFNYFLICRQFELILFLQKFITVFKWQFSSENIPQFQLFFDWQELSFQTTLIFK